MSENIEKVSYELIKKIYKHIERDNKYFELFCNKKKWLKITSALQVLEDSSFAIIYYCSSDFPSDYYGKCLYIYGVLQALFIQQDAANSIYYALFGKTIDFEKEYPEAFVAREHRNDVVGHPTNRSGKFFVYLSQNTLTKNRFSYFKDNAETDEIAEISVNVIESISQTASCVNHILNETVEMLEEEQRTFKEAHKDVIIEKFFDGLSYAKEKALSCDDPLSEAGYQSTKKMVENCRNELIARYGTLEAIVFYRFLLDGINKIYNLIDFGIPKCPEELQPDLKKHLLENLFSKLEELKRCCREIDGYFNS